MRAVFAIFLIAMVFYLIHNTEANYRKPPFNGSIFGKRGTVEYDNSNKAMSALCEISSETCQAWYQNLEK
uniref:SIFamide n=1 Tax=Chilo suppressalis TaxID=168631 RepID=A0A0S1U0F6_CHISP|nr:SIFamide precursor [Chilo suppressalis]